MTFCRAADCILESVRRPRLPSLLATFTVLASITGVRIAHAQDLVKRFAPDILAPTRYSLPDVPDTSISEPDDEAFYPFDDGGVGQTTKKSKTQTAPKPPADLRYDITQTGPTHGVLGGAHHAEKDVVLKVTDVATLKVTTFYADVVDYDEATGDIVASGGSNPASPMRLVMDDVTITGDRIHYNVQDKTGEIDNADVTAATFRLHGKRVEANADGSYTAFDAMFTTCDRGSLDGSKGFPDYRVAASKMTVYPGKYVTARHVTLYLGKTKTIPLPSARRNLQTTTPVSAVPTPSYDRLNGLTLHFQGEPESEHHATTDYNILVGYVHLPTGYVLYQNDVSHAGPQTLPPKGILTSLGDPLNSLLQQFNPPTYRAYVEGRPYEIYPNRVTFYGLLGNQQYIFNRTVTNLSLSRLPEMGIHIGNMLGKLEPEIPTPVLFERDRIPYAPALLEGYFSLGVLHESPTGITSGRAFSRLNFASQPQLLGPRLSWRYAATNWLNAYTHGTVYELFAPEVEMDYVPTSTSSFNIGYRYLTDAGETPFTTDHRDIRHELRLQYQVGGPYRLAVTLKYDLALLHPYDEEIAFVRNLDCLQYGVGYKLISRQFNIIISLLPVRKKQPQ